MRACIIKICHPSHGEIHQVVEITDANVVVMRVNDVTVNLNQQDIRYVPEFYLGREIAIRFRSYNDSLGTNAGIRRIAKTASQAWNISIVDAERALHKYLF